MERLQKVIANAGVTSRRKAEELIKQGKVKVNGEVITELGYKVDNNDVVMVMDEVIAQEKKEYYLLNKPRGYICAVSDDKGRKVVTELIDTNARIYPVGRLDYDTTGLLILTNDGELANKLQHPSKGISKTYMAKIRGHLTLSEYHSLKDGVMIDGTLVVPSRLKIKKHDEERNIDMVEITINVGLNHVVKKMFQAVNHDVIKLKRESIGKLSLGKLQTGEYRELSKQEIKDLLES